MAVDGFNDPLTRHFGYRSIRHDELTASSWIELRPDLLDERKRLELGVLAYLIDSTAGVVCGMAAVPAWIITSDLQFHTLHPATVGPWRADAVAVQPGRRTSLGQVRVFDEGDADRLVALGSVNHVVIQPETTLDVPADMPIGVEYASDSGAPDRLPFLDHFEFARSERGVVRLPIDGDAVNPLGILHGGLISTLAEQAARDAAGYEQYGVTDLVVRFLRGLRASPATATAAVAGSNGERPIVSVEVRDASGTLGAIASASLEPKGSS